MANIFKCPNHYLQNMSKVISVVREETGDRVRVSVAPSDRVSRTLGDVMAYWGLQGPHVLELDDKELSTHLEWSTITMDGEDEITLKAKDTLRTLPEELWKKRVHNEVESLRKRGFKVSTDTSDNAFRMNLELRDVPGPVLIGDVLATSFNHSLSLTIPRSYPYSPPRIQWKSGICHPDITPPDKGGDVSCRYLSDWVFSNTLPGLMEHLVEMLSSAKRDDK